MKPKKLIAIIAGSAVALAGIGTGMYFAITAKGPYSGTVVEKDTNTPIANVSVSDGRNVVKTDENGHFELDGYRRTRFITVTAPAGYETEEYYISAGRKGSDYNFTLSKSNIPAGAAHSFLQISDSEIGADGAGDWINHVKSLADTQKPAFLIHTGDICYEDGLKRHIKDMNTDNMGLPVRYIIGNHDYVDGKYGEELFESIYGPVWYSFEVGNVHYVVTPFQNGADRASGYKADDRWKWLENDLANTAPDMKVVIFNHNMPVSDDYVIEFDRRELDLKKHNLIAWVYGHYHYNYVQNNDGVLNISTARPDCGGIDSSASGTRLISINAAGEMSTEMFYYDFEKADAKTPAEAVFAASLPNNILFTDTVYQDGRIYTATVDDDWPRDCGVYCLNADSGEVIWEYKTVNSIKNNVIVADGAVYAQDCEGNVYCLNADDGKLNWQTLVEVDSGLCTSNGIVLENGMLYTGCAAAVTCLDADTGNKVWENIRSHGEGSPAEFIIAGDKLIVSSHWDALVALDKANGKQLWENKDEDIRFRSSTPVIIDDSTLLVADSDAIMLVDLATGEIKNKTDETEYEFDCGAQPAVIGDTAYIATSNGGLVTYSLTEKKIVRTTAVGDALVGTPPYNGKTQTIAATPVIDGDKLWFGAPDGKIYCVNAADGEIVKTIDIGAPVFGKLAVTDEYIYAADFAGRVLKITKQ